MCTRAYQKVKDTLIDEPFSAYTIMSLPMTALEERVAPSEKNVGQNQKQGDFSNGLTAETEVTKYRELSLR